jgi:hypothetical protein
VIIAAGRPADGTAADDREAEVFIRRIGVGVLAAAPNAAAFRTDVATGPAGRQYPATRQLAQPRPSSKSMQQLWDADLPPTFPKAHIIRNRTRMRCINTSCQNPQGWSRVAKQLLAQLPEGPPNLRCRTVSLDGGEHRIDAAACKAYWSDHPTDCCQRRSGHHCGGRNARQHVTGEA